MLILAVESSCDEFSVSILKNGKIISNIISSQIEEHAKFGGVIPELAARLHLENFPHVLKTVFKNTNLSLNEIDYVAYTHEPGLMGSLLIGRLVAKTIAMYINKPLLQVNHILGHIYGSNINNEFVYPVLALVISGGHTHLQLLNSPLETKIIGETQDDAIGECYDKVARLLNLSYPGGPKLDRLAAMGDRNIYKLPSPKLIDHDLNFSYSGLKTAANNLINNAKQKQEKINIENFAASFQYAAIKPLFMKLKIAINKFNPKTVTIAGGVAANSEIRKQLFELKNDYNKLNIIMPDLEYCTDNAAMIAKYAEQLILLRDKNIDI
ncbi:tRNA (adenosine(37)-N6)-threonylcarbamoyltransferase complex transferase subunit TsaD [Spiroplasma endosymbiont of Labia minor]|uniref:tRNA (adenosine(37)-N6)-threonylcarbamoyltransferase complex transferase subunit TsaD n=1 Tax=Spiroplasma endosymbiont of Labia minor TaxID=3066305 RepID=UPI0030CD6611